MTTCDEIESDKSRARPSLIRLALFFVMQGVAVILVGFAALFLSFEPVWSAERQQALLRRSSARHERCPLVRTIFALLIAMASPIWRMRLSPIWQRHPRAQLQLREALATATPIWPRCTQA